MIKYILATCVLLFSSSALGAESVPPAWNVVNWCIDSSNQSGCASDANDGQVCGCGSGGAHHGPFLTWSELYVNRWGCKGYNMCPRFSTLSQILIKVLSSDTLEIWNFDVALAHNVPAVTIQCQLGAAQTVGSGVLSSFTAKNRTGVTPGISGSGLNKAAVAGLTLNYNEIIFDSTHPSYFWPYYDSTTSGGAPGVGDTWTYAQPMLANPNWQEVTIASGDAVTVYTPPTILINKAYAHPYLNNAGGGVAPGIVIRDCTIGNSANDSVNSNTGVSYIEDAIVSNLQIVPGNNGLTAVVNVSAPFSGVDVANPTGGFGGQQNYIIGGMFGIVASGSQNTLVCDGCQIDGDLIFGQSPGFYSSSVTNFAGAVYVDVGEGIIIYPGTGLVFAQHLFDASVLWGPGNITAVQLSTISYPVGAGKAASTFLQKSGFSLFMGSNPTPPACYLNTVTGVQTCNLPVTATQLDTTLGATAGCFQVPGGASICN